MERLGAGAVSAAACSGTEVVLGLLDHRVVIVAEDIEVGHTITAKVEDNLVEAFADHRDWHRIQEDFHSSASLSGTIRTGPSFSSTSVVYTRV